MEDPDSQEDTGEYHKQKIKNLRNEKVSEKTTGERRDWLNISHSGIPMSSRIFRTIRSNNGNVQPFLRWYSSRFLPIVWAALLGIYIIVNS